MLEWQPIAPDARGYRSKCGHYAVCSIGEGYATWEAWKLAPGGPWFAPLKMGLPSQDAAREICEQDAAKRAAA